MPPQGPALPPGPLSEGLMMLKPTPDDVETGPGDVETVNMVCEDDVPSCRELGGCPWGHQSTELEFRRKALPLFTVYTAAARSASGV